MSPPPINPNLLPHPFLRSYNHPPAPNRSDRPAARQIDRLVYTLYGLTEEEIGLVEEEAAQ